MPDYNRSIILWDSFYCMFISLSGILYSYRKSPYLTRNTLLETNVVMFFLPFSSSTLHIHLMYSAAFVVFFSFIFLVDSVVKEESKILQSHLWFICLSGSCNFSLSAILYSICLSICLVRAFNAAIGRSIFSTWYYFSLFSLQLPDISVCVVLYLLSFLKWFCQILRGAHCKYLHYFSCLFVWTC